MKIKEKMIKRQDFFEDLDALRKQYIFDWKEVYDIEQTVPIEDVKMLMIGLLEFAIDRTGRITGDHDGFANLLYNYDSYDLLVEDYFNEINK